MQIVTVESGGVLYTLRSLTKENANRAQMHPLATSHIPHVVQVLVSTHTLAVV